jgi:hypothetical protein
MRPHADEAALVGLAWADTQPDVCRRATASDQAADGGIGSMPEASEPGVRGLAARLPGGQVAVGLEPSPGRLSDARLT